MSRPMYLFISFYLQYKFYSQNSNLQYRNTKILKLVSLGFVIFGATKQQDRFLRFFIYFYTILHSNQKRCSHVLFFSLVILSTSTLLVSTSSKQLQLPVRCPLSLSYTCVWVYVCSCVSVFECFKQFCFEPSTKTAAQRTLINDRTCAAPDLLTCGNPRHGGWFSARFYPV